MSDLDRVLADLAAESEELDEIVGRPGVAFDTPTPAVGWTIGHQIGHLRWSDRLAALACSDPELFTEQRELFLTDPGVTVDAGAAMESGRSRRELLQGWRAGRAELSTAMAGLPPDSTVPWLGPSMTVETLAVARLMETWAHGVDIRDALGIRLSATARLRHVADLGVRTRNFAYRSRALAPPAHYFRIDLTGPAGQAWEWGPPDVADRISGPALDFCLLVTRRRHRADLSLDVSGAQAEQWVQIAQVFAGPSGVGREPLGRR